MKYSCESTLRTVITAAACTVIMTAFAGAQAGNQDVTLAAGWNAVWLEVEPRDANGDPMSPETVFDTTTNDKIAVIVTPKPLAGLAEFFGDDPGTIGTFNQDEWQQWLRADQTGFNNLAMIFGNRPYLVKVDAGTPAFTVNITGHARFFRPTWTPDRFNLVGFGIVGTISFKDFFAPSGARHPVGQVYRLASNGNWAVVPKTDPIRNGVAYWIFCDGTSDYMGPVAVDFDLAALGHLAFGGPGDAVEVSGSATDLDLEELVFTNLDDDTTTPTLELITADPGAGNLDLHVVRPVIGNLGFEKGNQVDSTAGGSTPAPLGEDVAPESTAILTIGAVRDWFSGEVGRSNLYRLTTGDPGVQFWLPVSAANNDIQATTDLLPGTEAGSMAGLWVGEVIVDAVTSIVEDGSPSRPAAGSAPIRILLHSDGGGAVSLLSQVTIMRTKTADPEVDPVPVLVVDRARLPFFEGIVERNGKRSGLRLDAVAFDMPRKIDAATQAALLDDPAYPELTEEAIADFLTSRTIRPESLAEDYELSWALEGAIGAGKTVKTSDDAPLRLDPFHRSNPFRHAFHKQHPRGPDITRSLEIVFDPDQSIPDRLRGSFHETLQGVTKTKLDLTGRLELRRVSDVDTLNAAP